MTPLTYAEAIAELRKMELQIVSPKSTNVFSQIIEAVERRSKLAENLNRLLNKVGIMDNNAPQGTSIICTMPLNGWDHDKHLAEEKLEAGKVYMVEHTIVHSSSTEVFLQEFPSVSFNSVQFIEESRFKAMCDEQAMVDIRVDLTRTQAILKATERVIDAMNYCASGLEDVSTMEQADADLRLAEAELEKLKGEGK